MRFDTEMLDGLWSEETCQWTITTNRGIFVARYLITSLGLLSAINFPDIKGLDTFKGKLVHTGRWDHDIDLRGKRVGVIGASELSLELFLNSAMQEMGL
jgi:cyclohexanone monooxygenase